MSESLNSLNLAILNAQMLGLWGLEQALRQIAEGMRS